MSPFNTLFFILFILCLPGLSAARLVVGTLGYNPPFEMMVKQADQSLFYGFEVEVVNEVCRRIHQQCVYKKLKTTEIYDALYTQAVDLVIGGIIITTERKKMFLFSQPYRSSYLQFVTLGDTPFKTLPDISGKKLAVYRDSPSISFVEQLFDKKIQLVIYNDSINMLDALHKKEVDALVTSEEQALYWQANFDNIRFLNGKYPIGEGYGIMTTLQNQALIVEINRALSIMKQDGTYQKIFILPAA